MKNENIVKFHMGKAYIKNLQLIFFPLNSIVVYFYFLKKNESDFYNKFCDEIKKGAFQYSIERLHHIKLNTVKINYFINILNYLGYGKLEFVRWNKNNNTVLFKIKNSTYSKTLRALFNCDLNEFEDFFILNILCGFLEAITLKKVSKKFTHKNNCNYYYFSIETNKITREIKSNLTNIKISNEVSLNKVLKRVIVNKQLQISNGVIKLWGIKLVAMPTEIFENFNFQNYKNIFDLFEAIGKTQGRAAFNVIHNKFGHQMDNFKIFESIYLQTELVGMGKTKIIEFDEIRKVVNLEFKNDILLKNENLTLVGIYLLAIFNEVLSNIFNENFKYKINENIIKYESTNIQYSVDENVKLFSKYMGIEAITKK